MIPAAILGASGYAGGELVRFLDAHPSFDVVHLGAHTQAGAALGKVHPHLSGGDRILGSLEAEAIPDAVEVAFLALPHGASWKIGHDLAAKGVAVVDLGSDFRLDSPDRYQDAYGAPHPLPDELDRWVYGLPELFGGEIAESTTVAVPGCYPTSALLALAPLLGESLISGERIIVDSMSGVSGAGRGGGPALSFGAIDESVKAYKVLEHRHRPEIEAGLSAAAGAEPHVVFTPHLVPMQRGILTTAYAGAADGVAQHDLEAAIDKAYAASVFVKRIDAPPETRWVTGSNNALISTHLDARTQSVVVLCAIDNLVKGAAGQAVQCANLMFGFPEETGLPTEGWMP